MSDWEKVWFANSFKLDIFQAEKCPKRLIDNQSIIAV